VLSSKTSTMPPITPTSSEFRLALGQFATGVTIVTAERAPGLVHGMTANSFTSVSLDPLLILICVSENAQLLPLIQRHGRFGVNILRDNQRAISEYFARTEEVRRRKAASAFDTAGRKRELRCSRMRWCT
jgi:flavin reductase (DIM6/NTAB) family NADH-FMN oxidoreductase RutF